MYLPCALSLLPFVLSLLPFVLSLSKDLDQRFPGRPLHQGRVAERARLLQGSGLLIGSIFEHFRELRGIENAIAPGFQFLDGSTTQTFVHPLR